MNKTTSKRKAKAKAKAKPKAVNKDNQYIAGIPYVMHGRSLPDCAVVDLFYQETVPLRNNAGSQYISWRYRLNSAYDPDPALASGALSGFIEYAAQFSIYRVLSNSWEVKISNREAFPITTVVCPTPVDVGLNYVNVDQLPEFPYGKSNDCSASGGLDRCVFQGSIDLEKLFGSTSWRADTGVAALINANPTTLMYLNIGAYAGGTVFVNGIFASVRVRYRVHFYRRTNLPG
jgi:hypothetical protein